MGIVIAATVAGGAYLYVARRSSTPGPVASELVAQPAPRTPEPRDRRPPVVVPRPAAPPPLSNVPSGPAVAPLPRRAVAKPVAPPPSGRPEDLDAAPPPMKAISLDRLTKEIDVKTRSRLDAAETATLKPADFKAPEPQR